MNSIEKQLEQLNEEYRFFVRIKKNNPELANLLIKINQDLLIAAGKIHRIIGKDKDKLRWFYECTFVGMYYKEWRKNRAVSLANCFEIYKILNINIQIEDCIGETYYAGIPPVTEEEIDMCYKSKCFIPSSEKIGIDGKYHPVDEFGDFRQITDSNDIYGDNTNVTLKELHLYLGKENE